MVVVSPLENPQVRHVGRPADHAAARPVWPAELDGAEVVAVLADELER